MNNLKLIIAASLASVVLCGSAMAANLEFDLTNHMDNDIVCHYVKVDNTKPDHTAKVTENISNGDTFKFYADASTTSGYVQSNPINCDVYPNDKTAAPNSFHFTVNLDTNQYNYGFFVYYDGIENVSWATELPALRTNTQSVNALTVNPR